MIKNIVQIPEFIGKRKSQTIKAGGWFDIDQEVFYQHKEPILSAIDLFYGEETPYTMILQDGQYVVRFYLNKLLTEEIIQTVNSIVMAAE